jgi:hypothetical protein
MTSETRQNSFIATTAGVTRPPKWTDLQNISAREGGGTLRAPSELRKGELVERELRSLWRAQFVVTQGLMALAAPCGTGAVRAISFEVSDNTRAYGVK